MNDNLPPGVTLNDVDPPEMEDDPRLMYDTSHVKDTSDWHSGTCECCGGPTRWRWTGLRAVADTGDERMAAKQVVTEAESAAADLARLRAERDEAVRMLERVLGCEWASDECSPPGSRTRNIPKHVADAARAFLARIQQEPKP